MSTHTGQVTVVSFHRNEFGNGLLVLACTPTVHPHHNASVHVDGVALTLLSHDEDTFTVIVPSVYVGAGYMWQAGDMVTVQHPDPLY